MAGRYCESLQGELSSRRSLKTKAWEREQACVQHEAGAGEGSRDQSR